MIRRGDRILVGLSGGKDSGFLLRALSGLRARSPVPFEIGALTIDPTDDGADTSALSDLASEAGADFRAVRHPIFRILRERRERSPCSLCANIRRGMLATLALEMGYNVLALGHHRDDVVETVLMNLLYAGRFSCFAPHMLMSRSGIRVIRPLVYVSEQDIIHEARAMRLPIVDFRCPHAAASKRAMIKSAIAAMGQDAGHSAHSIQGSVMRALTNSGRDDAWDVRRRAKHIKEGSDDID
jgi:tRNA(Ile)-lysidine synthase TilS/MesJ